MKRYIKSTTNYQGTLYNLCKQWSDTYIYYSVPITVIDTLGNLLYEGGSRDILLNDSEFRNRIVIDISANPKNGNTLIQVE